MSLSHHSFSCLRVICTGFWLLHQHQPSTTAPSWLQSWACARDPLGHRGSPQTPGFGLIQQPEITPALLPPTQLGLKHSLNYATRASKSRSTSAKALPQPLPPGPAARSRGGHRPDTWPVAGTARRHAANTVLTFLQPQPPSALLSSTNWTSTSFSFRNTLPLTDRIKRGTENLTPTKCPAPIQFSPLLNNGIVPETVLPQRRQPALAHKLSSKEKGSTVGMPGQHAAAVNNPERALFLHQIND